MADKALISDLTWRSLASQKKHFGLMPMFEAPHEIPQMLRHTTRQTGDKIFVVSFGVIADNENDLREFGKLCKARQAKVISAEECTTWLCSDSIDGLTEMWREARRNGAAKIGARISADNKMAKGKAAAAKIADRWPMSSDEWPTRILLEEADISLNTAKAHLGKRPIAQYNYQAKLKRKANAKR